MTLSKHSFGFRRDGGEEWEYILEEDGLQLCVLTYGATIRRLSVPDRQGRACDVVLGYDTLRAYETQGGYLGAVIGRVANRIAGGAFSLADRVYTLPCNDGQNHLHGGPTGFHTRSFSAVERESSLSLLYTSPKEEGGYPGTLSFAVTYALRAGTLCIDYDALSDADTLFNPTSHCYFNLDGSGDILAHRLQINADRFLPTDAAGIPLGDAAAVADTPFDFRSPQKIGARIDEKNIQLRHGVGYDHNYLLRGDGFRTAAVLESRQSGIRMEVLTERPGLQLYTAGTLTRRAGKDSAILLPRSGICLETQLYPDAIHHPSWPSPVLRAGCPFHSQTHYRFSRLV